MASKRDRLNARFVKTVSEPGFYADGGNLYLKVASADAKSWVFRWERKGRQQDKGGGSAFEVSLADARTWADEQRALLRAGTNPLDVKDEQTVPTFGECADRYVEDKASEWRNEKHAAQWAMTLREYAGPLRAMRVDQITTEDVLAVLKPIWAAKPETASRLRGRIEHVLDAARAKGVRSGENPARWRGHLDKLLAKRQRLTRGHHAALAFGDVPAFVQELRDRSAVAAQALEFAILTAARSGEVLGARWEEIDLEGRVWTVPAARMKAGREHRVPLSGRATAILTGAQTTKLGPFVFPSNDPRNPLSNMAMAMLLKRMGRTEITVHGFRSAFRDWAGESTSFPREIAEAALAHVIGDKAEQAYRRGDALEKRRKLMEAWSQFCDKMAQGNIVQMRKAAR